MNLDKYELQERLGQGGMGEVWLGFDPDLDMPVAIKTLPRHLVEQDSAYVDRFLKEARTAARITHPNLVRVFAAGSDGDTHYIVMEFVEEQTIRDLIGDEGLAKELRAYYWSQGVRYQGRLDVRVLTGGLVLAFVHQQNWGDRNLSGGEWRKEIQSREQLKQDGWGEVGEFIDGQWLVLAKEWKTGDSFYIRTRKYATPKVIVPQPQN
jgi:serine/threonine protein kinase